MDNALHLQTKAALEAAYMPFVKNGGLFIPGLSGLSMGDTFCLQLYLLEDAVWHLQVKVIWLTIDGEQTGVGVQSVDTDIAQRIENYLR